MRAPAGFEHSSRCFRKTNGKRESIARCVSLNKPDDRWSEQNESKVQNENRLPTITGKLMKGRQEMKKKKRDNSHSCVHLCVLRFKVPNGFNFITVPTKTTKERTKKKGGTRGTTIRIWNLNLLSSVFFSYSEWVDILIVFRWTVDHRQRQRYIDRKCRPTGRKSHYII